MRMAAKALLYFLATIMAFPAHAQDTWVGFKPVGEVELPFKGYMENSIVLIDTVGDVKPLVAEGKAIENTYEIVDVSKVKRITKPYKLAAHGDPTKFQGNLRAIQIETCRTQNLQFCPVVKISSMSTGFFEDGKRLNTCRHAFHNWLVWASKANPDRPIETLSPPMILYSKEYKVLYNSATVPTEQLLKFSFINSDTRINFVYVDVPNPLTNAKKNLKLSDVAQLESSSPLVNPQSVVYDLDFQKLTIQENVYTAGYPGKTSFFSNGKGDAPGGKLVVSAGKVRSVSINQKVVQTNNLAKTGLSGAPLFRKNGHVVGIFCRGADPPLKDRPQDAKSSFIVFDKNLLATLWRNLTF